MKTVAVPPAVLVVLIFAMRRHPTQGKIGVLVALETPAALMFWEPLGQADCNCISRLHFPRLVAERNEGLDPELLRS